jgi:hypothetical protein
MFEKSLTAFTHMGRNFGEPDRRLDSFNLAKERPDVIETVMAPVLEQARRFRRDLPVVRIRPASPLVYMLPELVDDRRGIVLLLFGREPSAFIKNDFPLCRLRLAFPGLRNRGNEFRAPAASDDSLCGLALIVELPMLSRVFIGRVQDGPFKKWISHEQFLRIGAISELPSSDSIVFNFTEGQCSAQAASGGAQADHAGRGWIDLSARFAKCVFNGFRMVSNHGKQRTRRPVWLSSALFPVPDCCGREPETCGELRLTKAEVPPKRSNVDSGRPMDLHHGDPNSAGVLAFRPREGLLCASDEPLSGDGVFRGRPFLRHGPLLLEYREGI